MNESGSRFVDKGEPPREPRDRVRDPGRSAALGSAVAVDAKSLRPSVERQRSARVDYAVAALVIAALACAAFVLGRQRASSLLEPSSARQHVPEQAASSDPVRRPEPAKAEAVAVTPAPALAPQRRDLALIPFVSIEVEPAHGEIWLDRKVAGNGSVQLGAINDGMLHELRFVAPDYETKSLFFRNVPPAGRVILQRIVPKEAAAPDATSRVARGGPSVPAAPPARARPIVNDAPSEARAVSNKAPRVQLIELRTPRVEVLD
jgi:hypothetical protein